MVHSTAQIGNPPEHRDWQHGDPMHEPVIHLEARVNAYTTVDAGLKAPTRIGRSFVMAHCHIGHDAVVGDECELAPGTVVGGHAVLEDGVRCGIGVLILPFKRIGKGARLGAGAVVTKDVPAGEVWAGNPAKPLRSAASGDELTDCEREGWDEWWHNRLPIEIVHPDDPDAGLVRIPIESEA